MPDAAVDPVNAQLAMNGILSLADRVYLEQPYDEVNANRFFSLPSTPGRVQLLKIKLRSKLLVGIQAGQPTGVFWFDTASTRLGVCKLAITGATGGIQVTSILVTQPWLRDYTDGFSIQESSTDLTSATYSTFRFWARSQSGGTRTVEMGELSDILRTVKQRSRS